MGFFDLFSGGDSERAAEGPAGRAGGAGGELAEGGVEGAGSASKFSTTGTIPPVAAGGAAAGAAGAAEGTAGKTASQRAYGPDEVEHLSQHATEQGPETPALTHVEPGLPHAVRAMMTGHSFGEQNGKNVGNFNYMGMEPYLFDPPTDPKKLWTRANRSGQITLAQFEANPDLFIDWPGGGFGTISEQIKKGKKTDIFCMWPGPRIVYSSLEEASRSFHGGIIGWRLHSLQKSDNAEHKQIADGVMAGDVEAYIKMVTLTDKSIGVQAYNGNAVYPGLIRPHLNAALADAKLNALP